MTTFDFLALLEENAWLFFICVIPVVYVYIRIANKIGNSWFNPLMFNIFTAGIGVGVAVFLYVTHNASTDTFCYVIISSIVYWTILLKYFPKKIAFSQLKIANEFAYERPLFYTLYILNIVSTLFSYSKFGIPLFNALDEGSRLDTYTGSGGFGVILRLADYLRIYCVFYLINLFYKKRMRIFSLILWIIPFVIFGILSGSRSSFLIYLFTFWGYKLFYLGEEIRLWDYKKLLVPALAISLLSFGIEHATNLEGAFVFFMQRVAACGDLYWYALPDNTWESLTLNNPFKDLVVGLFAPMRLMSESGTDMPIGFQLTRLVYSGFDINTGPVELFTISSLAYWGFYGGILMVVIQAFMTCVIYKIVYKRSNNLIISSFMFYSFNSCVYFVGSLRDSMGILFNMLITVIFVLFILMILNPFIEVSVKKNRHYKRL